MHRVPLCRQSGHPVYRGPQCTVGESDEARSCRRARNSSGFVHFLEKHDCANIYKKRTICGSSTFPICVTEHVSDFPLSKSDHKPMQRGEPAPVCVKNRTWYYRGISKRPVKIKGFREVLRSGFGHCQHFFGVCCLMWLVKTVSYLKSNTSRPLLTQEWLEGSLEKQGSLREPDKDTCAVCTSPHRRQAMLLMVYLYSKHPLDLLAEDCFMFNISWAAEIWHNRLNIVLFIYLLWMNSFKWNLLIKLFCFWKAEGRVLLFTDVQLKDCFAHKDTWPVCSLTYCTVLITHFKGDVFWLAQILFQLHNVLL